MQPRLLVTGPVDGLSEYAQAARAAQWEAIEFPLLAIAPCDVDPATIDLARCDAIGVTSSNALTFVQRALPTQSRLRTLPTYLVGARTAERARALGLRVAGEPAHSAAELARTILALPERPRCVFWPHGNQSDEFGRSLRAAGLDVVDPTVYATVPHAHERALPVCDAVFFASPSAVREWTTRMASANCGARLAIAIGRTTFEALIAATDNAFRDILSLPQAESEALTFALTHVDRQRLGEHEAQS